VAGISLTIVLTSTGAGDVAAATGCRLVRVVRSGRCAGVVEDVLGRLGGVCRSCCSTALAARPFVMDGGCRDMGTTHRAVAIDVISGSEVP